MTAGCCRTFTQKHSAVRAWGVMNIVIFGCSLLGFTAGFCILKSLEDPYIDHEVSSKKRVTEIPSYSDAIAEGLTAAISPYYKDYYSAYDGTLHLVLIFIVGIVFSSVGIIAGILLMIPFKSTIPYYIWIIVQLTEILAFLILGFSIVALYQSNVLILACQFFLLPCPFLIWSFVGVVIEYLLPRCFGAKAEDSETVKKEEVVNQTTPLAEKVSVTQLKTESETPQT